MAATQACPNCHRSHDVAIYVTGQKVLCQCGIRFEVNRRDPGSSQANATLNLRPGRMSATPVAWPNVADGPNSPAQNAVDLDVTYKPVTRPSGQQEVPVSIGVPAPGGPAPSMGPRPGVEIPGYELTELLGRGGMGEVWRARQTSLGRMVAVKLLPEDLAKDREFVARFEKEATALARLSHPNIIQIIDRGEASGHYYYFVMEFVDGTSLRELMNAKKLTVPEVVRLVTQILRAMEAAHDGGIIHRDLKPENILVDARGHAKVADFGLAGMRQVDERLQLTGTAVAMGTINYMAPEQRRDARNVDHRADLYSMGVILYELLTGDLPVGRFRMPSERVPGTDPRLDEIVGRLLETEPKDRYASATEVLAALEPLQSNTSITPASPSKIDTAPSVTPRVLTTAPSIVEKGFKGLRNGLMVIGALAVIAFGARMLFGRDVTRRVMGVSTPAAGTNGATNAPPRPNLPTATGNTDSEVFVSSTVAPLEGGEERQRLVVAFGPGNEEINLHAGEWNIKDGALDVVQVGNEVETGEKLVPRAYLAKRYFKADDFDAEVEVVYRDVRDRYLLPEDGISQFAELAFRIKNVQVSVFAIPGGDARMLWRYFTPDGVEIADNSARRVDEGLEDVTPAPKDGVPFKLRLQLKKAKNGVLARAFLNGNEIARKLLPGLEGQTGKLALGCRNYECVFRSLSVEGKPAPKPVRRRATAPEP